MSNIISIDLKADFGFLKKPDTNDPIYLTFNMLHKPALLGILGAILGLGGFSEAKEEEQKQPKPKRGQKVRPILPEYYHKLKTLKIGIKPLRFNETGVEDKTFDGNFQKTIIKYINGVGYANQDGGTLIVTEQTLIQPCYRCYILMDGEVTMLYNNLKNRKAEFLPYLGKNDFSLWWDNFQEYEANIFSRDESTFTISSIFVKEETVQEGKKTQTSFAPFAPRKFMLFENLPIGYNEDLIQYDYKPFAYTDWDMKQNYQASGLYKITNSKVSEIIQVF